MEDALPKKILEDASNKGFLLELEIAEIFDKKDWFTRPNARFLFNQEELEIDLLSHKSLIYNRNLKDGFDSLNLICSCKKNNENPWVFFLSDRRATDHIENIIKGISNCDFNHIVGLESYRINFDKIKLSNKLNLDDFTTIARTYCVSFADSKAEKGKQIYKAITEILSYLRCQLKPEKEKYKRGNYIQKLNHLYIPLIVLEGRLFGINKEKEIKELDYLPLIVESGDETIGKVLIYVVKKEFINTFLEKIEKDHLELHNSFEKILFPPSEIPPETA